MTEPSGQSPSIPAQSDLPASGPPSQLRSEPTQAPQPSPLPQQATFTMRNVPGSEFDSASPIPPGASPAIHQQHRPSHAAMQLDEKRETPMGESGAVHASSTAIPQIPAGGAPARKYLNENVVPYLLEGMKSLAKEQPANPLHVLGEYLIQKSKETESANGNQSH